MRSNNNPVICLFMAGLAIAGSNIAYASGKLCSKSAVVEIDYDAFGMLSPQGKYLYYLVCDDRSTRHEVEGDKLGTKKVITGHLTKAQFLSLERLLDSDDFKGIQGILEAKREVRDYSLTLEVRVERNQSAQDFKITSLPSINDPAGIPQPALNLLCWVDGLRGAGFRVTSNCGSQ